MRLPRDLSGTELAKLLRDLGYEVTRQSGSHMRLTTSREGEHHVTIPRADPLRVGTLSGILGEVARHFNMPIDELAGRLFAKRG
jgi:predicted RNA binding protein YcfA (HicA-like mRNA interferase family)